MNTQKAFEAELFAKQHYRKLLTAKSSIGKMLKRATSPGPVPLPVSSLTPLDRYEYQTTNNKICSKLREIYKCPQTSFRRYRHSSEKNTKSMNEQALKEQSKSISKSNVEMFERILCAKSTITEDWQARERKLKRYGKLARKKTAQTDDCLFTAYRELLMQSRTSSARKRPQTSRTRQTSSAKSRRSEQKIEETI